MDDSLPIFLQEKLFSDDGEDGDPFGDSASDDWNDDFFDEDEN